MILILVYSLGYLTITCDLLSPILEIPDEQEVDYLTMTASVASHPIFPKSLGDLREGTCPWKCQLSQWDFFLSFYSDSKATSLLHLQCLS